MQMSKFASSQEDKPQAHSGKLRDVYQHNLTSVNRIIKYDLRLKHIAGATAW